MGCQARFVSLGGEVHKRVPATWLRLKNPWATIRGMADGGIGASWGHRVYITPMTSGLLSLGGAAWCQASATCAYIRTITIWTGEVVVAVSGSALKEQKH